MDYTSNLITIASTVAEPEKSGILASLGIDWTLLAFQTIAFLILVALLSKYVYPVFVRVIDERQSKIEESTKAAERAEKKAEAAQDEVQELMRQARKEASEIVTTAKEEAAIAIEKAEDKARVRAEHITSEAHAELQKDIAAARVQLRNDTLEFVALATEKVVGKTVTPAIDKKVISQAIEGVK